MRFDPQKILATLIVLGGWYLTGSAWGQEIFLKDDFESGLIAPIWTTKKLSENALRHVSHPTRTGQGAIEISVFPAAKAEIGGDGQMTERAELREAPDVRLKMGMASWYAFSFFLPVDFPIVKNRLVIARWKQSFLEPHKDRSPIVSLRYMGGKMKIDVARDRGKRRVFNQKMDLRSRWVDMIFRLRPKTDDEGLLEVWKDGVQIVDYRGPLGFKDDEEEIYFKLGPYRDHMDIPMRIIYDRFRRGDCFEAVSISTE